MLMYYNEAQVPFGSQIFCHLRPSWFKPVYIMSDSYFLMAESKEELNREPLDEGERGVWKSWLKTQHSKH